jgi:4-carboxymuconolactone decarboxylase
LTDRMPPVPASALTEAQREAVEAFRAVRKGVDPFGPFVPLLRSPEVMRQCGALGEYLRYRSALGTRLTELVVLMVARSFDQGFEWGVHAVMAETNGLAPATIAAIGEGRRPAGLEPDEAQIYDAVIELQRSKGLSDATYGALVGGFGEQAVIDLAAIVGYYGLLALVLNVARTPVPDGAPVLPRLPG